MKKLPDDVRQAKVKALKSRISYAKAMLKILEEDTMLTSRCHAQAGAKAKKRASRIERRTDGEGSPRSNRPHKRPRPKLDSE